MTQSEKLQSKTINGLERPSVTTGIARIVRPLDRMMNPWSVEEYKKRGSKRRAEAIKKDWAMTGKYLRTALEKYAEETEKGHHESR